MENIELLAKLKLWTEYLIPLAILGIALISWLLLGLCILISNLCTRWKNKRRKKNESTK